MSGTPTPTPSLRTPNTAPRAGGQGAGAGAVAPAGGAPKIKVRYYRGHNDIVTFYLPREKIKIYYIDQNWLEPVVEFLRRVGKHKIEKRWGYSRLLHGRVQYKDDVWVAEVDADELVKLVTTSKTWERSVKARKIVEYLEELVGG
jgi:hypothetical protein